MNEKIDLLKPHVRHFCKEGYLEEGQKKLLYDLSNQYGVNPKEVDSLVQSELLAVRQKHIEHIYRESGQPDAALHDEPDLFTESVRKFPEMLNVGTLQLRLNEKVEAPAFIPVGKNAGICISFEKGGENAAHIFLENVAVRLLLSLPKGLVNLTLIDIQNMGGSFINLSGLDERIYKIIDEPRDIQSFLQNTAKNSAAFNFKELKNDFADIAIYNKANRSKARPYQVVLCAFFNTSFDDAAIAELEKVIKLGNKTGVFFLIAADRHALKGRPSLEKYLKDQMLFVEGASGSYMVHTSENLSLFNKVYRFSPVVHPIFHNGTIAKINHELDPLKWPLGIHSKQKTNKDAISDLEIHFARDEKGKAAGIRLSDKNNHCLLISASRAESDTAVQSALLSLNEMYYEQEVNLYLYNCSPSEALHFLPQTISNVVSDKSYLLFGMLEHIQQIVEERTKLFAGFSSEATDFTSYREHSTDRLPRILCCICGLDVLLSENSIWEDKNVLLLDSLIRTAHRYGVHFLLTMQPADELFKFNVSALNQKVFISVARTEIEKISMPAEEIDLDFAGSPARGIIINERTGNLLRIQNDLFSEAARNDRFEKIGALQKGPAAAELTTIIEENDTYPASYLKQPVLPATTVGSRENIRIGYPRYYANNFSGLPILDKGK